MIKKTVFRNPKSYDSRKLQFLFGLRAFLEDLEEDKLENLKETIKDFILRSFRLNFTSFDLKNYLNIYSLMQNREVDQFWEWSFFNEPTDGKWRKRKDNAETYFLKLMFDIDQKAFENLEIEQIDSETLSLLEFLHPKMTIDQKLKTLEATNNKNQIYDLLRKISIYQHQKVKEYVGKGELDQDKIKEFINKFKGGFEKTSYMRGLFKSKKNHSQYKK